MRGKRGPRLVLRQEPGEMSLDVAEALKELARMGIITYEICGPEIDARILLSRGARSVLRTLLFHDAVSALPSKS
jgi:hypothetical protein